MNQGAAAILLSIVVLLWHCASAAPADDRAVRVLGGGDASAGDSEAERGLPWLPPGIGGQPFDRLPPWLQQLFDTDSALRSMRADLARIDASLEREKAELRAAARTPEEIATAEAMFGGAPPAFDYALIMEPRERTRILAIQVTHGSECGSAGCTILIYVWEAGRWRQVAYEIGVMVVLETWRVRRFPVFTIWDNHDPCSYLWNGTRYQAVPRCPE